jgi:hypothetical protein
MASFLFWRFFKMRVVFRSAPFLLIGFALIGCSKESGKNAGSAPSSQAKVDPSKPSVELKIPSMH